MTKMTIIIQLSRDTEEDLDRDIFTSIADQIAEFVFAAADDFGFGADVDGEFE